MPHLTCVIFDSAGELHRMPRHATAMSLGALVRFARAEIYALPDGLPQMTFMCVRYRTELEKGVVIWSPGVGSM